jgi:hypothetical protein
MFAVEHWCLLLESHQQHWQVWPCQQVLGLCLPLQLAARRRYVPAG